MKILDAYRLAAELHRGQVDKIGRPYIEHLSRVFLRVLELDGDRSQQIAALLHDSIEDQHVTWGGLIKAGVPDDAAQLVVNLSRARGENYLDYIRQIKGDAVMVKLADLEDNLDPQRLLLLEAGLGAEAVDRLRAKYEQAREVLLKGC